MLWTYNKYIVHSIICICIYEYFEVYVHGYVQVRVRGHPRTGTLWSANTWTQMDASLLSIWPYAPYP